MNNLIGLFNTGKLALSANQKALSVTGNNIANVNTPGYTRQRANFEALQTGGVQITDVERMRDQFIDVRMRDSNSRLGSRDALATNLRLLETALNETDDTGISKSLQDFFASIHSLTTAPAGSAERFAVRSRAELLNSSLKNAFQQTLQVRRQVDEQIRTAVNKVNSLTTEIAAINQKIVQTSNGQNTNSLQDQRDQLIEELSAIVPVRVLDGSAGSKTVIMPGGVTLVEHTQAYGLAAETDPRDGGVGRVLVQTPTGGKIVIEDRIDGGSLGGLIQVRDVEAPNTLQRLDQLAAELIRSFNAQHRLGTGLDGVSNRNFFTGLSISGEAAFGNFGGATVGGGAITDQSLLTFHDYEIRFTSSTSYDVVDATLGTTLSSGNAYTSGSPIAFDGMQVAVTSTSGPPVNGDVFRINSYEGSSNRIGLTAAVQADTGAIAAGLTAAPGDNQNALALANLQNAKLLGLGDSQSLEDFHIETRSTLGLSVEVAGNDAENENINILQLRELADSAHSVSQDEEAINLIQYERAYQAASRIISVTDELLQTTINMI